MKLELPYPPSTNHNAYWGQVGHRRYLTKRALDFRLLVQQAFRRLNRRGFDSLVSLTVDLFPPDRRRRDVDGGIKPLLDALQAAGAISNDYLVQSLQVDRRDIVKGGLCVVTIKEWG